MTVKTTKPENIKIWKKEIKIKNLKGGHRNFPCCGCHIGCHFVTSPILHQPNYINPVPQKPCNNL